MRVLVGCEYSGVVRRAFAALGHEAYSCDLLDSEDDSEMHIKGDVRAQRYGLYLPGMTSSHKYPWDLVIFHPPCTYLARSGIHWNGKIEGRAELTEEALEFVKDLMSWDVPRIALENPIGVISTRIREPDQIIQPYDFGGDDASKSTGLWLKNLPKLKPTVYCQPKMVVYQRRLVARWANQTASGQSNASVSDDRAHERSRTYEGIAAAMAAQWSVIS